MAKGRMLNRSIRTDKRVNNLSEASALLYCMTIPWLDRDGITSGDTLWADVCPLRVDWMDSIDDMVKEWTDEGLVIRYQHADGYALYFTGFSKNQTLTHYSRETESEFPPPPGYQRSGVGPELIRSDVRVTPPEVKEEVKDEVEVKEEVKEEVKVEDEVLVPTGTAAATPPSSLDNLDRRKMIERLQSEWPAGVGGTQIENHAELVELYGIDDWRRGFDATKKAARSNPRYVDKVIISEREKNNVTTQYRKKSKVEETMDAFDRLEKKMEQEGVEGWQ